MDNVNADLVCSGVSSATGLGNDSTAGMWTEAQIVEAANPVDPARCGIYFLIYQGAAVYVGQSIDVDSRIRQHMRNIATRPFDAVTVMQCPREDLFEIELAYIKHLWPPYNNDAHSQQARLERNQKPTPEISFAELRDIPSRPWWERYPD